MININKANSAFNEYVKSFDMNNDLIRLKYDHTYRVCKQSANIAKSIGLDEEQTHLAYLIALLHDIGRFEQARVYNTFKDEDSIDHADFGCELLFKKGLIRKFIEDDKYDDKISFAIKNHNKFKIEDCDDEYLLQSKIIRDADKIDIMYNVSSIGLIKINSNESVISDGVKNDFDNYRSINRNNKKTQNDSVLTMLCFPFDLNFDYSFEYIKAKDFINKMYEKIKNKKIFNKYVNIINEYIEGKCKNVGTKIRSQKCRRG